jgi:hypothetical protein
MNSFGMGDAAEFLSFSKKATQRQMGQLASAENFDIMKNSKTQQRPPNASLSA